MVVSAEIAQNQKGHIFVENGVFGTGEKSVFTNCFFAKAVFFWKQYFIVSSAKHSSCNKIDVCWKQQKAYAK